MTRPAAISSPRPGSDSATPEKYKQEMARHDKSQKLKQELTEKNLEANRAPDNAEVRDRLAELCDALGKSELATMWRRPGGSLPTPAPN
ncbi:MAG: hypothetical protein CM1200mP2_34250 [Planctomycetaceae bacterium]|nr:MAG: hypothetical protein CM1200mP2_34250 [Planctomycetaceae bacterium]